MHSSPTECSWDKAYDGSGPDITRIGMTFLGSDLEPPVVMARLVLKIPDHLKEETILIRKLIPSKVTIFRVVILVY